MYVIIIHKHRIKKKNVEKCSLQHTFVKTMYVYVATYDAWRETTSNAFVMLYTFLFALHTLLESL